MFRTHYDGLCRYGRHLPGPSRDTAETWSRCVRAHLGRPRALVVSDLPHYLYAAVRRRATSQFRRCRRPTSGGALLALEGAASAAVPPDANFEAEELRQRLERALTTLPPAPAPRSS